MFTGSLCVWGHFSDHYFVIKYNKYLYETFFSSRNKFLKKKKKYSHFYTLFSLDKKTFCELIKELINKVLIFGKINLPTFWCLVNEKKIIVEWNLSIYTRTIKIKFIHFLFRISTEIESDLE